MVTYLQSSIFDSPAQTLVNTVNTVGVMGKGIAKEFKQRHPKMFLEYRELCNNGSLVVGSLHIWRGRGRWVLNFPTKTTWRRPSKIEYVEAGLRKFIESYEEMGITSISFPPLGCGNGNLDWAIVRPLMDQYLRKIRIPVYIHDLQVSRDFVPEHFEQECYPPLTFSEFVDDLHHLIQNRKGRFSTLHNRSEFLVHWHSSDELRVMRADGSRGNTVPIESLESAWVVLQSGLLTSDQFTTESAKRYKSYLLPVLASLPYVRTVKIKKSRKDGIFVDRGMFFNRSSDDQSKFVKHESASSQLCLSL